MAKQPKRIKAWTGDRLAAHPVEEAVKLVKANANIPPGQLPQPSDLEDVSLTAGQFSFIIIGQMAFNKGGVSMTLGGDDDAPTPTPQRMNHTAGCHGSAWKVAMPAEPIATSSIPATSGPREPWRLP